MEPRSSRLKDKKKGEGEILVKDLFVQDVLRNNNLLHILGKGSSVVILPRISSSKSICSGLQGGFQSKVKARLFTSLCSPDLEVKTRNSLFFDDIMQHRDHGSNHVTDAYSMKRKHSPVWDDHNLSFSGRYDRFASSLGSQAKRADTGSDGDQCDRVTSQGLFSCVTCGILCFASVAMIQPTETASEYLMSGDCNIFNDWEGTTDGLAAFSEDPAARGSNSSTGWMLKRTADGLFDVPIESAGQIQPLDEDNAVVISNTEAHKDTSSLGLLALNYGNCSDSEDDVGEAEIPVEACETKSRNSSPESNYDSGDTGSAYHGASSCHDPSCPLDNCADEIPLMNDDSHAEHGLTKAKCKSKSEGSFDYSKPKIGLQHVASNCSLGVHKSETTISTGVVPSESTNKPFAPRSDEDSSRMHIFCLQHAVQVEQQLRSIGGAHVVLLCHPDYPEIEAQAKKVAEELGNDHLWSDISFREASKEDEEMIQLALDSEEAIHGNGDWAVKMGINLYYSANLSRSPLYSKQMPYNRVIYNAFGCKSIANTVNKTQANGKWSGRHKKLVVAGKWCGKVWMSNQVHPLLAERESEEQEQERNIPGPVKADLKLQRPSECTKTAESASTTCKVGRKRKTSAETRSVIKAESLEAEDPEEDFEVLPKSGKQHKNNFRNKRMKKETPEPQIKRVRNSKQLNSHAEDAESLEAEDPEEDFEVLPISSKQHKNKLRNKRMKKETPEPRMKCVRSSKQLDSDSENAESLEAEDPEEDFEVLPISGKQHKNKLRNKRMKKETPEPQMKTARNSKQLDSHTEDELEGGPSTRLRKRTAKPSKESGKKVEVKPDSKKQNKSSKAKKGPAVKAAARSNNTKIREEAEYQCDMDGCSMSFGSKQELILHKRNICPVKGCGKKFFSHKYLVQHRRVHMDDRPLKCPWKGCKMTFKWAWARTEHIRVHTGARPYVCAESGCGQTFRFVSDFSRHKRKTGHASKKVKK